MSNSLMYSNILLWVFMILQTVFIYLLTKSIVEFLNRFKLEKANTKLVTVGAKAPLFRELTENGEIIKLSDFNQRNTILFFAKATCNVCKTTLITLNNVISSSPVPMRLIIVTSESEEFDVNYHNDYTSLVRSDSIIANYDVYDVPTIIIIDPNGIIINKYSNDELNDLRKDLGLN